MSQRIVTPVKKKHESNGDDVVFALFFTPQLSFGSSSHTKKCILRLCTRGEKLVAVFCEDYGEEY